MRTEVEPASIRAASPVDARRIAEVHVEAWRWAYRDQLSDAFLEGLSVDERASGWHELLDAPGERRAWVAEEDGRVVGFCSTGPGEDDDAGRRTAGVHTLYLTRDVVGRGVGRALLERAVEDLRERGFERAVLWVLEANDRGRRFYERAGWKPDGTVTTERIDCEHRPTVRYATAL